MLNRGVDGDVACPHPRVSEGRCLVCNACTHDVVLNGAWYFCGATDIEVTVVPAETPLVPADRLRRRR